MTLELQDVCVRIEGRAVVDRVSLSAATGTVTGVLGPNGSGKSTLLRTLYRARRPSTGRIRVDGDDLLALTARDAARRVAAVPQEAVIEFDTTVRELVGIGRHPHQHRFRAGSVDDHDAVDAALDALDLRHVADRSVLTLSGGERQRAHVARALAQDCAHLVLDEPTNHLDVRHQVQVLDVLGRRAAAGATVVAALHDLGLAALYCDVVHLMVGGRVVASGPPADVITAPTVRAVYGADVDVVPHPQTGTPFVVPRRGPTSTFTEETHEAHPPARPHDHAGPDRVRRPRA